MATDFLMEEREELMVSPTGGAARLRTAHFLKPSVTSIDGPVAAPSLEPPTPLAPKPKGLPLKVKFSGWRRPQEKWNSWVEQMRVLHRSTWERAGILDAIANSTYDVHRDDDLIFGFLDRWCPATNTFVLPWGEATVTLEDVKAIGGYSVLGGFVLSAPADGETKAIVNKLLSARSSFSKMKSKKPDQNGWITKFMGSHSEIEHEAFLAYWLSRFVFPFNFDVIGKNVLSIAVPLAGGIKIALAPAVLACIYKSLSLLKAAVVAARKSGQKDVLEVTVSSPLALVQAWIWERFPTQSPKPNSIGLNEPRLARWDKLKKLGIRDLSLTTDSAAKDFIWRPYVRNAESNAFPRMIYMDIEYWAFVEPELDDDLEGLIRCLRSSELVGLEGDCIEQYLPHRVARQFGMDQDIPGHVPRVNVNPQVAWDNYTWPIGDEKLYVPPRLSEPQCTTRYLKWWGKLSQGWCGVTEPGISGKITSDFPKVEEKNFVGIKLEDEELSPPPGFSPKRKSSEAGDSSIPKQCQDRRARPLSSPLADSGPSGKSSTSRSLKRKFVETSSKKITDYYVSPKRNQTKGSKSGIKIKEAMVELSSIGSYRNESHNGDQGKDNLSSTADNVMIEEDVVEPQESGAKGKNAKEASEVCGALLSPVRSSMPEAPGLVVELEERIKKLEEQWNWLKAGNLLCRG